MTKILTMRRFGDMGRWGNQLLQYAALTAYAKERGAEFLHPPWLGESVFSGVERAKPVSERLPQYTERYDENGQPVAPEGDELLGRDFHGWAQWHTSWWTPTRREVWRQYELNERWRERMAPALEAVGRRNLVGVHLRRGDYGQGLPWDAITPTSAYLAWLERHWAKFKNPLLFVASEDRALVRDFAAYEPQTVESLGVALEAKPYPLFNYLDEDLRGGAAHRLDFLPEWILLGHCGVLLAANSTFSFTAALWGPKTPLLFRPNGATGEFQYESPWNTWPLRKDRQS